MNLRFDCFSIQRCASLLLIIICLPILTSCSKPKVGQFGWTTWSNGERIEFDYPTFSDNSSKIYFCRAATNYQYRQYWDYDDVLNTEYHSINTHSAIYEMALKTRTVRKIIDISPISLGDTTTAEALPKLCKAEILTQKGNRLYYRYINSDGTTSQETTVINLEGTRIDLAPINLMSAYYSYPKFSPNGELIASFLASAEGNSINNAIFIYNINNGTIQKSISTETFTRIFPTNYALVYLEWLDNNTLSFLLRNGEPGPETTFSIWNVDIDSGTIVATEETTFTCTHPWGSQAIEQALYDTFLGLFLVDYSPQLTSLPGGITVVDLVWGSFSTKENITENISDEAWK